MTTGAPWADEAVQLTIDLIRNACVNDGTPDSGNEIRSVRTVQEYLGDTGTVIEPAPGRGSVILRITGTDPDAPTVLMLPHLDVVPASPHDWTHPPFEGKVVDGMIWGRGAVDMLNVTGAMVAVFKGLRDGDLAPPAGDVILACVADEEAGGSLGAAHLAEHYWDLVECDVVLTEVAGPNLRGSHGSAIPVTVAEKGPAWRHVVAHGVAGHGSQPYARSNAVLSLSSAFADIGSVPQPVHLSDEWLATVPHLPIDTATRARLTHEETVDVAIDDIAEDDPTLARWIHACTHLTFSPNVIHGGAKSNVVADAAEGDIDVRMLPGQDATDVNDHLRKVLGPARFDELDFVPVLEMEANASPTDGAMWEALGDAAEELTGSRTLAPLITPVSTDARFFRTRGVPAYGAGLFDDTVSFAEMLAMFHGADERVSVESVRRTAAFIGAAIGAYGRRTSRHT